MINTKEMKKKASKTIYLHEVRDYLNAYAQIREILARLDIPSERISTRSHLKDDLDLDEEKKSKFAMLLEQQYGIPVGKDQMQYVSDVIELILVEG